VEYNRDFEEGGKKIANGRWKMEKTSRIRVHTEGAEVGAQRAQRREKQDPRCKTGTWGTR
jgi:hypothetical protein